MKTDKLVQEEIDRIAEGIIDYCNVEDLLSTKLKRVVEENKIENINLFLKDLDYTVCDHDYYMQDYGENYSIIVCNFGEIELEKNYFLSIIDEDCVDDFTDNGNGFVYYGIPAIEIIFDNEEIESAIEIEKEKRK